MEKEEGGRRGVDNRYHEIGKVWRVQRRRRLDREVVLVAVVVVVVGYGNGDAVEGFSASGEGIHRRLQVVGVVAEHRLHRRPWFGR